MRAAGMVAIAVTAWAALGACGAPGMPKTVDQRWITRCNGGGTNAYGITREHACLAAGKGYEDDDDLPDATAYYKRGCDVGSTQGCIDWARLLSARGNATGARFVLSSSAPCETDDGAAKCGWALVASLEKDEPTRTGEIPAALHGMCDRHHVASACKRLALVEEPARVAKSAPSDGGDGGPLETTATAVPPSGRPKGCSVLSDCVTFDLARDEGACEGSLRVNVTNHCNERVYCSWCQSSDTNIVDRSTCGGHWFEVDQTYRGAASFCEREKRGDDVVFTCASAKDPPACTRL